ncbi:MAG: L,D-transpeptidase family protein [Xanthobacteraceae bacterium]
MLLGNACVLALGLAAAMSASPALAKYPARYPLKHQLARQQAEHARKLPFGNIPKGPLEIFISIDQQRLHFYSDGVHIADEPVATGVPGHLTPLGIFSVIQRDRYHHSNIYDNAPMPFMQRITWSGVALHEGPGVGHEASHGCIRMPGNFAARLWMLPTMGMRVVIARPELRPIDFADPHLFVHQDTPIAPSVTLRPTIETAQVVKPGTRTDVPDPPAGESAVASPAIGPNTNSAVGSVATSPASSASAGTNKAATNGAEQPALAATVKDAEAAVTQPANATSAAPVALVVRASAMQSAPVPAQSASAVALPNLAPASPVTADTASVPTAPPDVTTPSVDDVPLPPIRPAQIAKGYGPIAIFISRKEKRIYVRQNFTPLFNAPVTIEHPDQPLGTYLFTAMDYLPDHSTFRWTVVALPPAPATRWAERWKYVRDPYGRLRRVRVEEKVAAPVSSPDTPQDALARIQIPEDVIDQISQLIVSGSSLIVSDQGLGPETGRGTDFIVISR